MKHKAEESLSHITLCDRDKPHSHISDAYRNDISELHKLINCQLTVEEMKFIANCLYVAGFVDENMVKQILGKFQKQKEMWASEDE